jgi:hypothetical protein
LSYINFEINNLDNLVYIELNVGQVVQILKLLTLYLEIDLSNETQDILDAYQILFEAVESYGSTIEEKD